MALRGIDANCGPIVLLPYMNRTISSVGGVREHRDKSKAFYYSMVNVLDSTIDLRPPVLTTFPPPTTYGLELNAKTLQCRESQLSPAWYFLRCGTDRCLFNNQGHTFIRPDVVVGLTVPCEWRLFGDAGPNTKGHSVISPRPHLGFRRPQHFLFIEYMGGKIALGRTGDSGMACGGGIGLGHLTAWRAEATLTTRLELPTRPTAALAAGTWESASLLSGSVRASNSIDQHMGLSAASKMELS